MITRVLMSTINYDHPQRGMAQAFGSLFPEVRDFDFMAFQRSGRTVSEINASFVEFAIDFAPEWIWLQVQETDILSADTLLEVKRRLPECVISHWMGDCRALISAYSA